MYTKSECKVIEKGIEISWLTWGKMRDSTLKTGEVSYIKSDNNRGPERIFKINFTHNDMEWKICQMICYIRAGIMPDSMLITPNTTPDNLADILSKRGFDIDDSDPCMILELNEFSFSENTSKDITVLAIEKEEQLPQWVEIVNKELFGYELITLEQFNDVFKLDNTHFYLGLLNGLPAAACMTITEGETSVLEMVATLDQHRRKGLATAVINKALDDIKKKGVKTISLRAEKDGVGVYKKIGFKIAYNRVVASCNWEKVHGDSCPCYIEKETIAQAEELFKLSSDIETFVSKMNENKVIGKKIWYDKSDNSIYLTKLYPSECGTKCNADTDSLNSQRCHCEYIKPLKHVIPLSYCKCSAAFFEPMFTPLFGDNIVIEPVYTVLKGDERCIFKISL